MGKIILFILFLSLKYQLILARPNGPPSSSCRDLNPQHRGSSRDLGFQLTATDGTTFTPGGPSIIGNLILLCNFTSKLRVPVIKKVTSSIELP